jgi:hypothetical protein
MSFEVSALSSNTHTSRSERNLDENYLGMQQVIKKLQDLNVTNEPV